MSTKKSLSKSSITSKHVVGSSSKKKPSRDKSTERNDVKREEKPFTKSQSVSNVHKKKGEESTKKSTLQLSRTKTTKDAQIKKQVVSKTPRSKNSDRPVTPPSSRVTKTQFFPSKKLYTNALKEVSGKNKKPLVLQSKESKRNVVIEKNKKDTYQETSSEASSLSERPRTATLRKGSIVNNNIVGPEAPNKRVIVKPPKEEDQSQYEDDFDSYESDFEEYEDSSDSTTDLNISEISTGASSSSEIDLSQEQKVVSKRINSASTDDERKLDSGNFELPPDKQRKHILDNIKESEKENINISNIVEHSLSNLGSLSDEGFEEGKSLQFINFLGAHQRYKHRKSIEKKRKRGEEILSMIKLDYFNFILLDLAPVPYDKFILNHGKSNTVQTSVQTGDDNLNEEVQTENIGYDNKWTQFPTLFPKIIENEYFWDTYRSYYLGVGGDTTKNLNCYNHKDDNIKEFLHTTGNLILNIQAEESSISQVSNDKSNIPFSKKCVTFNTHSNDLLQKRKLKCVSFYANNLNKFLTLHGHSDDDSINNVVCIWNICNTREPEEVLITFGEVSCYNVSLDLPNLIFSGLTNGSIALWDIRENILYHKLVEGKRDVLIREPNYTTEINYGHTTKVVAVESLKSTSTKHLFNKNNATEMCSLDEDGDVIVWSVITKEESRERNMVNQAFWGSVVITLNIKISLKKLHPEIPDFKCTDLGVNKLDPHHLHISTNYGIIIHCLSDGSRHNIKKFLPNLQVQSNCIETCPFSSQYIAVGFADGQLNFYSHMTEKPLVVLSNKESERKKGSIEIIQWSFNRPLMLYTKDASNTLNVWNLKASDMFPVISIPFKDEIVSFKLSPVAQHEENTYKETYMLIATNKGLVYLHQLDNEHGQQLLKDLESDKNKLFNYLNRHF